MQIVSWNQAYSQEHSLLSCSVKLLEMRPCLAFSLLEDTMRLDLVFLPFLQPGAIFFVGLLHLSPEPPRFDQVLELLGILNLR
jgi:hypothetical protein